MTTSHRQPSIYDNKKLTEAVSLSRWILAIRLVQEGNCNDQQRYWVIEEIVKRAPERYVDDIIEDMSEDELVSVSGHFIQRHLWRCVGHALQCNITSLQHRWFVDKALKHANEWNFCRYVLQHCTEDELEHVITSIKSQGLWKHVNSASLNVDPTHRLLFQSVSRGLWKGVGKLLQLNISREQHSWAVEEASKRAGEDQFLQFILPQCYSEELALVLPRLLTRTQWMLAGKVLELGVTPPQQMLVVERGSRQAGGKDFVHHILPWCNDEELDRAVVHLVSRGLWWPVGKVLERGISYAQRTWAVEETLKQSTEQDFAGFILPHCTDEELKQVLTHMALLGRWEPVDSVTQSDTDIAQHTLSQLVSRDLWRAVGAFLQRGVSRSQHRWAVEHASNKCSDFGDFLQCIFPQCREDDMESVMIHLMNRGQWNIVGKMLEQTNSACHRWIIIEAAKHAGDMDFNLCILPHCSEDDANAVLPALVVNKKWQSVQHLMHDMVRDALQTWITGEHDGAVCDTLFWNVMRTCHVDLPLAMYLTKAVTQEPSCVYIERTVVTWSDSYIISSMCRISSDLAQRVLWQRELCQSLMASLLHTLCYVMCSENRESTHSSEAMKQHISEIYAHITACIEDNTDCLQDKTLGTLQNKQKWAAVFTELANTHNTDPAFLLYFLQGLNLYHLRRRQTRDDAILLVIFAVFPLFPQLQSAALKVMATEKRWDVLSQACLSHVWEHDRRQLFKAAVEQRQWKVVRQWADHSVHDDQRDWAMKEAFREGQWGVYLLLADHGLTMQEQMHAFYIVAKYGDWHTVLQMVERGGDITEVSNLLETWVTGNLRKKPKGDATVYLERCKKLIRLRLRFAKNSARSPMKALERCLWGSVLFNILHKPAEDYFSKVLYKVIEEQEWHILMHLVRLGMNRAERDWLFPEMVTQQQWGVCRKLLEIGVNIHLCLEALPELMEKNQWTLVARVIEYSDVDDAMRCQVMLCAFQRREGVLFWHCLTTMKNEEQLSMETRVKLFHQAISHDIWQAVKPLVEEKDDPGIQCRDMAFLEAIEQHLWDVVDYCQIHGADINMEDENRETPLHREARKREWKAVEEIVFRDGKPNLLDMDGASVLNRLINYRQWDTVKFVIKYGGDIHLRAGDYQAGHNGAKRYTPLQAMIDVRQMDVILFTIGWCPNQKKGVNDRGETTLHAACDSDRWDVMEELMIRRVDPLAVTKIGQSALVYAVLNTQCPQRMVAECCRLGFSTHQPALTGPLENLLNDIICSLVKMWMYDYRDCYFMQYEAITSPLVCAILSDNPVVTLMLYESGACSYTELFALYTQLPKLVDLSTEEGRRLLEKLQRERLGLTDRDVLYQWYNTRLTQTVQKYTGFLKELATTPRTLQSSCRLLVSHSINIHDKKWHRLVDQLPVTVRVKNYLKFSDLTDPHFGVDMVG